MRIVDGGASDIARLEPLWLAMVSHHIASRPAAAESVPFRDPPETWTRRRRRYEEWIHEPGARLLVAENDNGEAVGYAFLRVFDGESTMATGDTVAHLESLAVLPQARGSGVGSALIDSAFEYFRNRGLTEITLSVMDGNDAALRLYERYGLRRYHVEMLGRLPEA